MYQFQCYKRSTDWTIVQFIADAKWHTWTKWEGDWSHEEYEFVNVHDLWMENQNSEFDLRSDDCVDTLKDSVLRGGLSFPILISSHRVVDGFRRLKAFFEMGYEFIPVKEVHIETEDEEMERLLGQIGAVYRSVKDDDEEDGDES